MKKLVIYNIALLVLIFMISLLEKDIPKESSTELKFSNLDQYTLLGNMKRNHSEGKL